MKTIRLVELRNPHFEEKSYQITESGCDNSIWRIFINPDKIDFIREVVQKNPDNLYTEISVGGHVFEIQCTLDALTQYISQTKNALSITDLNQKDSDFSDIHKSTQIEK